jgi:hypothetical protein
MWDSCVRAGDHVVAERSLDAFSEQATGRGRAHLLNISILEYLFLRVFDPDGAAAYRRPIEKLLHRAGAKPRLALRADGEWPPRTEVTWWEKEGRQVVCVIKNPLVLGTPPMVWKESFIPSETVDLELSFDRPVRDAVDERTGQHLGEGRTFRVPWRTCQAAMISFRMEE